MSLIVNCLLDDEDPAAYVETMAGAFRQYPVMIGAFGHRPDFDTVLRTMVAGNLADRRANGIPTYVARLDGEIVGGAFLHEFISRDGEVAWWDTFLEETGPQAVEFFAGFLEIVESFDLPQPNTWLSMLGVRPGYQGKGIGKAILNHIQHVSIERETRGVALDTEREENVAIYRSQGFEVVGTAVFNGMPIWAMFRPNKSA